MADGSTGYTSADDHPDGGYSITSSLSGLADDHWVTIQRSTFTNWVHDQLAGRPEAGEVTDLQTDLRDGWRLCALMEALQHRRIPHATRRPFNQHQMIDNINLALRAMEEDGIRLVNIGTLLTYLCLYDRHYLCYVTFKRDLNTHQIKFTVERSSSLS